MIKNLLYSLFLHFLLLLAIYTNFNTQKKPDENNVAEIAVALISIDGTQDSKNLQEEPVVKNEEEEPEKLKKEEAKDSQKVEAKSQKESPKEKVKKRVKKVTKAKPISSDTKPAKELSKKEFKEKITSEKVLNEEIQDKEQKEETVTPDEKDNKLSKDEDLGASKKEEEKSEETESEVSVDKSSESVTNNIDNLNLSAREKFNIQSQLKRCYNRAIDETQLESDMKITVKTNISEDGYISSNLNEIIDSKRYNDPKESNYKIAIDNARRAIDLCSPLRNLPLDKYYIWKEVILDFGKE